MLSHTQVNLEGLERYLGSVGAIVTSSSMSRFRTELSRTWSGRDMWGHLEDPYGSGPTCIGGDCPGTLPFSMKLQIFDVHLHSPLGFCNI
jgi:hypothetical protein